MEVLCNGLNVVDLLAAVPQNIPYGGKTACEKIIVQGGAPAGNAACGISALGHEIHFLGYLGDNTLSQIGKTELERHGVRTDKMIHRTDAQPAIAIVQVDGEGERTVLYSVTGYYPLSPSDVVEQDIIDTRLVIVDGYDTEVNTHLLRLAKKHNKISVLDMESAPIEVMKEMVALATYPILPLSGAQTLSEQRDIEDCALAIDKMTNGTVVITDGINGSVAVVNGQLIRQAAYKVDVVDTTGCGDAFHAAFTSAILQGMSVAEAMNYGSFFAAQVATVFGGRTKFPTREFMESNLAQLTNI
ncbi:carbohydrate kinase family protein [Persicobacter psychrovividus]|uniref:Sulfofructose kinase n=1 Tax=Persicobacter psychrovividus TaxID=387638 RepID=A0ABM7VMQ8_9BACT|nr:sulfofructose kinase [Persicobacter psychrovividus]